MLFQPPFFYFNQYFSGLAANPRFVNGCLDCTNWNYTPKTFLQGPCNYQYNKHQEIVSAGYKLWPSVSSWFWLMNKKRQPVVVFWFVPGAGSDGHRKNRHGSYPTGFWDQRVYHPDGQRDRHPMDSSISIYQPRQGTSVIFQCIAGSSSAWCGSQSCGPGCIQGCQSWKKVSNPGLLP